MVHSPMLSPHTLSCYKQAGAQAHLGWETLPPGASSLTVSEFGPVKTCVFFPCLLSLLLAVMDSPRDRRVAVSMGQWQS